MSGTFNFKGIEEANPLGVMLAPTMLTFIPAGGSEDCVKIGEAYEVHTTLTNSCPLQVPT